MGLEPISKDDFCGEKILASREGVAEEGLGGNSAAPERSATAKFRISLCEMCRQKKLCLTSLK